MNSQLRSSDWGLTNVRRLGLAAVVFVATLSFLVAPPVALASPGQPDRDMHPYVGMLVIDLGDGWVFPYCHVTLISDTEAVTAHHCAPTGSEVSLTFDNPVVVPAQIHTGTVRMGGNDFGNSMVDIAIIDLHEPVELSRYAQIPLEPIVYGPGDILDFVTYISEKQSAVVGPPYTVTVGVPGGLPAAKFMQNEPAQVEFDRNLMRTSPMQGGGRYETAETINTTHVGCYGNSGSPMFPRGTDVIAGVLSFGSVYCVGGGNTYFARTDSELAIGILTGTVTPPPPPPPPPPPTEFPRLVTGSGASGALSFPATIVAGSEYTGAVTGLSIAEEAVGEEVPEDWYAVASVSVSPDFHSFTAALRDDYTSGNDDLDLYLVWYMGGDPFVFFGSNDCYTSDEGVVLTSESLSIMADMFEIDDLYNFEVWVHVFDAEAESSTFTLFASEYLEAGPDQGTPTVAPAIAGPENPYVTIEMSWSELDPLNHMYLGWIEHFIDGIPEPPYQCTVISIDIPQ